MYVQDMTLEEAREFRADVVDKLAIAVRREEREQLRWDLEDLDARIDELEYLRLENLK